MGEERSNSLSEEVLKVLEELMMRTADIENPFRRLIVQLALTEVHREIEAEIFFRDNRTAVV